MGRKGRDRATYRETERGREGIERGRHRQRGTLGEVGRDRERERSRYRQKEGKRRCDSN